MKRSRLGVFTALSLLTVLFLSSVQGRLDLGPPRLTDDELRYTLNGVRPDLPRDAVRRAVGFGTRAGERLIRYDWGELMYDGAGRVAWVHGSPLCFGGKPVINEGDSVEAVTAVLGSPEEEWREDPTLILSWPRHRLTVQFLDDQVYLCTLTSRHTSGFW